MLTWMQSKDGAKGRNRPKPVSPLAQPKRVGRTDRDPDDVKAMLARFGPQHGDNERSGDVDD